MEDKILVPLYKGYGRAVEGLGEITDRVGDFMELPQNFRLILFTGGEDVSPHLYKEKNTGLCYNSYERDLFDMKIYKTAKKHNIKMAGICRGAQFLNVMAGGRMMHHIENHTGCYHCVETSGGALIQVNSLHHQMIVPSDDVYVTGWSKDRRSHIYIGENGNEEDWRGPETEAIVIPDALSCGVQWHPESMPKDSDGYQFFHIMIEDLLTMDISNFMTRYTKEKTKVANSVEM